MVKRGSLRRRGRQGGWNQTRFSASGAAARRGGDTGAEREALFAGAATGVDTTGSGEAVT